jgi:hypothetical protein
MSASVRKNSVTAIGIHKAPAHLSKREFEENVDRLVDSMLGLPEAQKNLLSLNVVRSVPLTACKQYRRQYILQIFQNNHADASMKDLGYPAAHPCVLLMAEFEVRCLLYYASHPLLNSRHGQTPDNLAEVTASHPL